MCAGNLAQACGDGEFPQQALEEFTRFALECLNQTDAKFELKETAINYFSEISKILKSKMAQLIPTIVPIIIESTETKLNIEKLVEQADNEFDLDSDEDSEDEVHLMDLEGY